MKDDDPMSYDAGTAAPVCPHNAVDPIGSLSQNNVRTVKPNA
jgi:hypothetical protein